MYDLASDPGERRNLAGEQPFLTRQLQQTAVRLYTRHIENWSHQVKYKILVLFIFYSCWFWFYLCQLPTCCNSHFPVPP